MVKLSVLPLLLFLAANPASAAEGSDLAAQFCTSCHGADGVAMQPGYPHLNGQVATYLVDTMVKLQKGRFPTQVPNHVSPAFSGAELGGIAEYFAKSKALRPMQEVSPERAAKGEKVYLNRCADCHPDNGRDADKDAPLMAAQNLDYLLGQTRNFVAGKRKFGFLQDEAFQGLSAEDLECVAHFFAGQSQVADKKPPKKRR